MNVDLINLESGLSCLSIVCIEHQDCPVQENKYIGVKPNPIETWTNVKSNTNEQEQRMNFAMGGAPLGRFGLQPPLRRNI